MGNSIKKTLYYKLIIAIFYFYSLSINTIDLQQYQNEKNSDLFLWCKNQFQTEEKILLKEILTKTKTTNDKWTTLKKEIKPYYLKTCINTKINKKCLKPFSLKTIKAIKAVLKNKKIKKLLAITSSTVLPHTVTVYRKKHKPFSIISYNNCDCDIETDEHNLLINDQLLNQIHLNQEEIEATFAHEMIHILFKDAFVTFCIENLIQEVPKNNTKKIKKLFYKLMHLQEQRADILSALANKKYIKHSKNFFKRQIKEQPYLYKSKTHPSNQQRLKDMQLLEKLTIQPKKKIILDFIFYLYYYFYNFYLFVLKKICN